MKKTIILSLSAFIFSLGACLSHAQNEEGNTEVSPGVSQKNAQKKSEIAFGERFKKLDDEKKKQYANLWMELQKHAQTGNNLMAIKTADEMEEIIDKNPSIPNTRGIVYLKLKDIEKAKGEFIKALEIDPTNETFQFNLGETFFVSHEYEKANKIFLPLREKAYKNKSIQLFTRSLLDFKLFIINTKLGNKENADKYAALYTIDDDTPFYYCVKGIREMEAGNKQASQNSFMSAINIYGSDNMYQPFGDALVETGYMESFEGPTVKKETAEKK